MHEIFLPEAKPALEWVNNRVLQKVSPKRKHALAQGEFITALGMWARTHRSGTAGTEWHFQIQPPGEISRTLVPDVAFLSYRRMPRDQQEVTEVPRIAPDVVVEVRSPDDRQGDIDEKVRVYLAAGTTVIFLVDPERQTITIQDAHARRVVEKAGTVTHDSLPGFRLQAQLLFEAP